MAKKATVCTSATVRDVTSKANKVLLEFFPQHKNPKESLRDSGSFYRLLGIALSKFIDWDNVAETIKKKG